MQDDDGGLVEAIASEILRGKKDINHAVATAALEDARAALSAIEREGFKVVPVEPTEEMMNAEPEWETHEGTPETGPVPINPVRAFWTAMLSAAPKQG